MLALRRARLRVHHDVGRNDFSNAFFDRVAELVYLLEAGGARHADSRVHKMPIAGAPHAYAVHIQNAFHAAHRARNFLPQAFRSGIHQRVHGALAEHRAHPQNDPRHREAGYRIGINQPGQVPDFSRPDQPDAANNYNRAPYVG